ncbi:MAG: PhoPQ-activated protein PqaA family protein [Planctomycetota bacterium]
MRNLWVGLVVACSLSVGAVRAAEFDLAAAATALSEYVQRPDESFAWKKVHGGQVGGADYAELTLTSQTWRGVAWKHQLFVIKPKSLDPAGKQALLYITGGSWDEGLESQDRDYGLPAVAGRFAELAETLRSPLAVLLQVPHQPMFEGKYEDQIIAHTFREFLRSGESDWPLLAPMTKAAVRGMDAVQQFCIEEWSHELEGFTVTGASKRGWTTWLAASQDERVKALAPMVIDVLRMDAQLDYHVECWGDHSSKISDYTELGLHKYLRTPGGQALQGIVDPWSYRERITQPKWVILGTNDRYWPVDAANLYWDGLRGPKRLLNVPNNRHGLTDLVRVAGAVNALHQSVAGDASLAEVRWEFEESGGVVRLRMECDREPKLVQTWRAQTGDRDFRGALWTATVCEAAQGGYVAELPVPGSGHAAIFGEAVFDELDLPYYVSTTIRVAGARAGAAEGGE